LFRRWSAPKLQVSQEAGQPRQEFAALVSEKIKMISKDDHLLTQPSKSRRENEQPFALSGNLFSDGSRRERRRGDSRCTAMWR